MKEQTSFHIPTPCHEDWNNMTPEGKGRFCASCSKQVVDFSLMSDQQVLTYFKNSTGKVCGRFADDQLQRPIVAAAEQKKKVWWVAMMMPLLILFGKTNAQKKKINTLKEKTVVAKAAPVMQTMGLVAPGIKPVQEKPRMLPGDTISFQLKKLIRGSVNDEKGNIVPFATISIENSSVNTLGDSAGEFELQYNPTLNNIQISVSSIGYESSRISLERGDNGFIKIVLKEKNFELTPVAVQCLSATAGGITMVKSITIHEKIDTVVRKIIRNEAFKIFPNPVSKNAAVKLEIKKAGEYSIQLLDNTSKLILIKDFIAANNKTITEITPPSSLAAGMYYIRLIDEKKKKQYADKLIVQ